MFTQEKPTILDGGLSTALEELGATLNTTLWSGELLRSNRDQIRAAHQSFADVGAQILITSSYQISYPGCLARSWSHEEVTDVLRASTELARVPGVKVAASVGPYGAYLADGSEYRGNYGLSVEQLKDFHRERLSVLISSDPDYLAIETIPELDEARAILELLNELDSTIPFWISFSCRNGSEISSGELFKDAVSLVTENKYCFGVGINCTAPEFIAPLMESAQSGQNFVIYPNSGRTWDAANKKWMGDQSSVFTSAQIVEWRELGAVMIGGCCGVGPADIQDLASAISASE
jgi:homocysteine S-methyltransferase